MSFQNDCIHPSRRIAEPVIGRAFARPVGDAPQDEVLDPRGEESSNAARLEPRGGGMRRDDESGSTRLNQTLVVSFCSSMISGKRFAFVPRENRFPLCAN